MFQADGEKTYSASIVPKQKGEDPDVGIRGAVTVQCYLLITKISFSQSEGLGSNPGKQSDKQQSCANRGLRQKARIQRRGDWVQQKARQNAKNTGKLLFDLFFRGCWHPK